MTLVELLETWRATRSPRVADAIDRASEAIDRPAIDGPNTTVRVERWSRIAAQRDPHDVGRLVAMAMPRTKGPLAVVIRHLVDWHDDPRIAMALVRFVEDRAQRDRVGTILGMHAIVRLGEIGDVRILPRLHALYERVGGATVAEPIAKLEAIVPLDPPANFDEGPVSTDVVALLVAFANDPSDRATLAVLGDALVQRGDPRGQLIALQLAEPSEARTRAARALIDKHGRAFAGELDRWFAESNRLFELGFFAGGQLTGVTAASEVDKLVDDPLWAFVRVLEVAATEPLAIAIANRPEVRLRALGHLTAAGATRLASASIEELHLRISNDLPRDLPDLPALRTLGLAGPISIGRWAAEAPLLERLHRLVITPRRSAGEYLAIAERGGNLRELEIHLGRTAYYAPAGWRLRLIRDAARGPFARLVATRGDGEQRDAYALLELLRTVPDGWPTEIVVESSERVHLQVADARELEVELARFTNATTIRLPWTRPTAWAATSSFLRMVITGCPQTPDAIDAILEALALPYDVFQVNFGNPKPLGDDPSGKLVGWLQKKATRQIVVSVEGSTGGIVFKDGIVTATIPPTDFAARFAKLAATVPFAHAIVVLDKAPPYRDLAVGRYAPMPPAGWLIAFPKKLRPLVEPDDVRALGVQVFATGDRLTVAVTEAPDQLTEPILDRFTVGLRKLAYAGYAARAGYDFVALAREALAPLAQRENLVEVMMTDLFHVEYQRSNDGILERVHARLDPASDPPMLLVEFKRRTNVSRSSAAIGSRDDLVRELAKLSALP